MKVTSYQYFKIYREKLQKISVVKYQSSEVLNYGFQVNCGVHIKDDKITDSLSKICFKKAFAVLFVTFKDHQSDFQ